MTWRNAAYGIILPAHNVGIISDVLYGIREKMYNNNLANVLKMKVNSRIMNKDANSKREGHKYKI